MRRDARIAAAVGLAVLAHAVYASARAGDDTSATTRVSIALRVIRVRVQCLRRRARYGGVSTDARGENGRAETVRRDGERFRRVRASRTRRECVYEMSSKMMKTDWRKSC